MVVSSTDIVSATRRVDYGVDRGLRSQLKLGTFNGLMTKLGTHPFRQSPHSQPFAPASAVAHVRFHGESGHCPKQF
jgi:hypothetical protein